MEDCSLNKEKTKHGMVRGNTLKFRIVLKLVVVCLFAHLFIWTGVSPLQQRQTLKFDFF